MNCIECGMPCDDRADGLHLPYHDNYSACLAALRTRIAELEAEVARLSATTPMQLLRQRLMLAEKACEAADKAPLSHKVGCELNTPAPFSERKRREWEQRQCSCGITELRDALAAWREGK